MVKTYLSKNPNVFATISAISYFTPFFVPLAHWELEFSSSFLKAKTERDESFLVLSHRQP